MAVLKALRQETPKLLPLFLPILISQYAGIASGVVDAAMAGYLGTAELASIAVGVAVWVPFQAFLLGLMYGLVILVSQYFGSGDRDKLDNIVQQGLYLGLLVGIACGVALYGIAANLEFFGVQSDLARMSALYIRAEAWGLPPACLMFVLRFYCEGQKAVMPITVISVISIGVKALFNYMFLFGRLGVPELGVVGCGIATVCTNVCFLAMVAGYICLSPRFAANRLFARIRRPDFGSFRLILHTGTPIGLCFTSEFLIFSVMTMFISQRGVVAAAAHQIGFNCMMLFFSMAAAFSGAACIRVGILFGSGDREKLRTAVTGIISLSVLIGGFLMAAMILSDSFLAAAFTKDPAVIPLTVAIVHVVAIFQVADSLQVCLNGVLRGIGDVMTPFLYTTVCYWVVGIPLGYALSGTPLPFGLSFPVDYGIKGWWMGLTAALFLAASLLYARVRIMYDGNKSRVAQLLAAPAVS